LKPSAAVKHATAAYRSEMDFIQQWLDERTVVDPQACITRNAAYTDYKFWSEFEHAPTLGNRRFVEELHGRRFPTTKSNGVRRFSGLRLQAAGTALRVVGGTAGGP
jgi:putative DNA primase/helicase